MARANMLPHLEKLRLTGSNAADGVRWLHLPNLRLLTLASVKMGPVGAAALADSIGRGALPALTVLDIGANAIGDSGFAPLAWPLRRLPALQRLHLWECGLGNPSLVALVAPGRGVFPSLQLLNVSGNSIGDAGVAKLTSALTAGTLCAITEVDTRNNLPASLKAKDACAQALKAFVEARR